MKQVVLDLEAPLGMCLEDRHKLGDDKTAQSVLYGLARLQLFTEKGNGVHLSKVSEFSGGDAVLQAVAMRLFCRDGSPRAAEHIFAWCWANDRVGVQEALRTKFLDHDRLWRQHVEADLQYNLERGYLAIDVHRVAWEGEVKKSRSGQTGTGKRSGPNALLGCCN